MKFLSPAVHGSIDYIFAALFLIAPTIFGFEGLPATLSIGIGLAHLTMSMCTAYPLGLLKALPFSAHGWFDLVAATTVTLSPWVFAFEENAVAKNFFLSAGVLWFLSWLLSAYAPAEPHPPQNGGDE